MLRSCRRLRFGYSLAALPTPNPDCRQYRSGDLAGGDDFLPDGTPPFDVPYRSLGVVHPISRVIFDQYENEVKSLFIAQKYVTVTKYPDVEWSDVLERSLGSLLGNYMVMNEPVSPRRLASRLSTGAAADGSTADHDASVPPLVIDEDLLPCPTDSEVVQCIKELLRTQVRPVTQRDGGDVRFVSFELDLACATAAPSSSAAGVPVEGPSVSVEGSGVLHLELLGACKTCPSSENTLKDGIERLLQHMIPEVREVREVKTAATESSSGDPGEARRSPSDRLERRHRGGGGGGSAAEASPLAAALEGMLPPSSDSPSRSQQQRSGAAPAATAILPEDDFDLSELSLERMNSAAHGKQQVEAYERFRESRAKREERRQTLLRQQLRRPPKTVKAAYEALIEPES